MTGFGETAGAALAAHQGVDTIASTGSTEVGRLITKAATGNMKNVTLELGGKSSNIVVSDADRQAAIEGAAGAIFFNQGEDCIAGSRLYVQDDIFDEVVAGVADIATSIRVGNGLDLDTQMGPLVSDTQLATVSASVHRSRQHRANRRTSQKPAT